MRVAINFLGRFQLLTLLFLMSSPILLCGHTIEEIQHPLVEKNISLSKDDILGRWLYTVENVAYEYSQGALYITEKDGAYDVEIHVNNGTLRGQDVEVENDKIAFTLFVEGQEVTVTLTAKGDTLAGESASAEGTYKIKGKRKPMPQ